MKIIEDTRTEHKLLKFYIKHCCHPKVSLIIEDGRRVLGLWKNPQGWWTWTLTVFLDHVKIHFRFCLLLTLISYLLKKKKKELPWGTIKWTGPFKTYREMSLEKHIRWWYRQPGRHLHQLDDPRAPPRPSVLSEASLNTLFAYWRTSHTWEYTVEVSYFFQICQHCSFFFLNIEWHAAAAAPFNWGLPW